MNNKKSSFKRVTQVLCLCLIIASLVVSIVFSSLKIANKTNLNTRYSGGYDALVEIYDKKQNSTEDNSDSTPNGNASAASDSLQKKLSPFSDNTIDVKVVGKHRVSIRATKEQYQNNPKLFINAIEQDGGLMAFTQANNAYSDILFDDASIKKTTASENGVYNDKGNITNKLAISEIFGSVKYTPDKSQSNSGQQNSPFLTFEEGSKGSYLKNLTAATTTEGTSTTTPASLTVVSSFETILNNIREYFLQTPSEKELDTYLENYYWGILAPISSYYTSSTATAAEKAAIDDFFAISYKNEDGTSTSPVSLISGNVKKWWVENTPDESIFKNAGNMELMVKDLKALFYGVYDDKTSSNCSYSFTNNVSKYVIDPNSTTNDFKTTDDGKIGKYAKNFTFTSLTNSTSPTPPADLKIDKVSNAINNIMLTQVLFNQKSSTSTFSQYLEESVFDKNFIMINDSITQTGVSTASTMASRASFVPSAVYNGDTSQLKVKTRSATIAKTIEASISQTTSGFTFRVVKLTEFSPEITLYMLLASIIFLIILAIITMVFLIIAYRLLGLYTLIIAVTSVAVTLFAPTLFGIAIGIELYTLIFVMLGLVLESCILTIESFKKHLNKEKRSITESFKLSNRENLGIIIDSVILILIPNLIIFWVGTGSLKNFATVSTVSTAIILILIIVVFRLIIYITVKLEIFKKHPLWLPIDTKDIKSGVAIREKIKLSKLEYQLNVLTNKDKVSSKELLKIKKINDEIESLKQKIEKLENEYQLKQVNKNKAKAIKLNEKIEKLEKTDKKIRWYKKDWIAFLKVNRDVAKAISTKEETVVIEEAKTKRSQNWIFNINRIIIVLLLVFSVIGGIVAATVGPNYSNLFGKDNTYIVYGDYLYEFPGTHLDDVETKIAENVSEAKAAEFKAETLAIAERNGHTDVESGSDDKKFVAELSKYTVEYVFNNNLVKIFYSGYSSSTRLNSVIIGEDYGYNDESSSEQELMPYIQIELSSQTNITKTKRLLNSIFTGKTRLGSNYTNETRGILGMYQIPFTAYGQITQIIIAFGILLLILIIYILIRYKWTYYVALALALVVVVFITGSLVIMFRVPLSTEILVTMVSIVAFTIMSVIFILGKTKSLISIKTKNELRVEFDKEANAQMVLKHKVLEAIGNKKKLAKTNKDKIKAIKKKIVDLKLTKKSRFYMWDAFKACFKSNKNPEIADLRKEIKAIRKQNKVDLKLLKKEIWSIKKAGRKEITLILKENKFVKSLFVDSLRFGVNRLIYISGFYLLFAIILAVTIPSIAGVGITLLIGVFVANIVILTMLLPLLIWLEKRRIVSNYGRKEFISQTNVSQEEQIVKDIND
ncbi:protein translocase SecDF, variant type [Mesoplasma melaleucae]|uniref:Bifunctional preprotein translocase subunit SecD/SecF n=1 Tax=Mesoplasma melaleucae TaxID=81459 RepID=A0A2K8NYY6_9MOLU|nr:protein translocase SecDF, variant type [Mesoplasma melaleucae]ATZ17951.1 bifunctional preprotein translocase subunit SecD/SecF [Mesoplasma melaleucae]